MKKNYFILFLSLFFLFPSTAEAQLKGLLKEKALEAIQGKKVQEEKPVKVEEKESDPQPAPAPSKKPGSSFLERKMMQAMGLNNVKFDPQYNFTSSMVMDIKTIDSLKNEEEMQYTTFYNPDDKSFALVFEAANKETGKKEKSTMIFDMKNYAMIILSDDGNERSGVALTIPRDSIESDEPEPQLEEEKYPEEIIHPWYSPTGKSKTIAGYTCKEYTYKSNEGSVDLWVTNDSKLNLSQAYGHMQGFQALATGGWAHGMGTVMEMVFTDKLSGASSHMQVKDIQPNSSKRIDLLGYQIVGVGGDTK